MNFGCYLKCKRYLTLLTVRKSPNQAQGSKAVSLVTEASHFDLPTGVCMGSNV